MGLCEPSGWRDWSRALQAYHLLSQLRYSSLIVRLVVSPVNILENRRGEEETERDLHSSLTMFLSAESSSGDTVRELGRDSELGGEGEPSSPTPEVAAVRATSVDSSRSCIPSSEPSSEEAS